MKNSKCCICSKKFSGYGNNPQPVKDEGRCCDKCNKKTILPARLKMMSVIKNLGLNESIRDHQLYLKYAEVV